MKSNSSSPPTLPSRKDPVSDIAVEWVPESGSEIWTPEPPIEELTDPNSKFDTIPTGPPDMDNEIIVSYRELPTLNYALQLAIDTLCRYEGKPMYKAIKSLHNRVRAMLKESK